VKVIILKIQGAGDWRFMGSILKNDVIPFGLGLDELNKSIERRWRKLIVKFPKALVWNVHYL